MGGIAPPPHKYATDFSIVFCNVKIWGARANNFDANFKTFFSPKLTTNNIIK